jgi:hypothetical protein
MIIPPTPHAMPANDRRPTPAVSGRAMTGAREVPLDVLREQPRRLVAAEGILAQRHHHDRVEVAR